MLEQMTKEELPKGVMDIIETIGIYLFKDLAKLAGGSNLHISNESSLIKTYRNKIIKKEFNRDYKSISRKFGISEVQVRNIINK